MTGNDPGFSFCEPVLLINYYYYHSKHFVYILFVFFTLSIMVILLMAVIPGGGIRTCFLFVFISSYCNSHKHFFIHFVQLSRLFRAYPLATQMTGSSCGSRWRSGGDPACSPPRWGGPVTSPRQWGEPATSPLPQRRISTRIKTSFPLKTIPNLMLSIYQKNVLSTVEPV